MNYKVKIDNLALKAFEQAAENFNLESLLTRREKVSIGKRILVAQAILDGKTRYEINNHISISPNTFTQIKKWLHSELDSYDSARQAQKLNKKERIVYPEPLSFNWLKKKYPAHFLLFSLVDELFALKK